MRHGERGVPVNHPCIHPPRAPSQRSRTSEGRASRAAAQRTSASSFAGASAIISTTCAGEPRGWERSWAGGCQPTYTPTAAPLRRSSRHSARRRCHGRRRRRTRQLSARARRRGATQAGGVAFAIVLQKDELRSSPGLTSRTRAPLTCPRSSGARQARWSHGSSSSGSRRGRRPVLVRPAVAMPQKTRGRRDRRIRRARRPARPRAA